MKYTVYVGNIGMVMETDYRNDADACFDEYMKLSRDGIGRAAGEPVVMFAGNEISRSYEGTLSTD